MEGMTSKEIIKRFGGYRQMAFILGCPPSTVHNWIKRKHIPVMQQGIVLQHAQKLSLGITAADLIIMPKKNRPHKFTPSSVTATSP